MSVFGEDRRAAYDLIRDQGGKFLPFSRAETQTFDPVRGAYFPAVPSTTTSRGMALVLPESRDAFGTALERQFRRMAYVAAHAMLYAPRSGDTATWEGTTWTVDGVEAYRPDGETDILYIVALKA